jgi:hypothetical protein
MKSRNKIMPVPETVKADTAEHSTIETLENNKTSDDFSSINDNQPS